MTDKNKKIILIYNPLSNIGHFDSWCSIFVKYLLSYDWTVIVVTKNSNKIRVDFKDNIGIVDKKLIILDHNSNFKKGRYFVICKSILNKLKIFEILDSFSIDIQQFNQYRFAKILQFIARINNYLMHQIDFGLKAFFLPGLKISATNPVDFADDIDLIHKTCPVKPAVVLNMYLDLYSSDSQTWRIFAKRMKSHWAGIHMDMTHTLVDRPYSKSKTLELIYTINEPPKESIHAAYQHFQYQWLPDVTDTSLPERTSDVATLIKKHAAGRKIIFLGGAIGGTKNITLWTELIFKLDKKQYFFVQIGKIDYSTLSKSDLQGLKKIQNSVPENVYLIDAYLENEAIFNEIISLSSVIWGVYRDFDRSSNILTKAALFSKPIVVSNRYLMGRRVIEYKIGMTVSETNVEDVSAAITTLMDQPVPNENYAKYAAVYSAQALAQKLDQSLQSVIR